MAPVKTLILHVDASDAARRRVAEIHRASGLTSNIIGLPTAAAVRRFVETGGVPDMVIAGRWLKDAVGIDLLAWLRGRAALDGIGLYLLLDKPDDSAQMHALQCGADGVVTLDEFEAQAQEIFATWCPTIPAISEL